MNKLLFSVMTLFCASLAWASGTFVPPPIPDSFKEIPVNVKINMGKALFNGESHPDMEPLPGKPCSQCHSGSERLKRKELMDIREKLKEKIALEHQERYGKEGKPLAIMCLYYYIYTRWRLDR